MLFTFRDEEPLHDFQQSSFGIFVFALEDSVHHGSRLWPGHQSGLRAEKVT